MSKGGSQKRTHTGAFRDRWDDDNNTSVAHAHAPAVNARNMICGPVPHSPQRGHLPPVNFAPVTLEVADDHSIGLDDGSGDWEDLEKDPDEVVSKKDPARQKRTQVAVRIPRILGILVC